VLQHAIAATDPHRLSRARLPELARRGVDVPAYDPDAVTVGHAHIGPGVFHRAHQAVYADHAIAAGRTASGICAISMRSARLRDALTPQDLLYTCVELDGGEPALRVIGSIREVHYADDSRAIVARLADPAIRLVTISATEAAYCITPGTRTIDTSLPEVADDLADPSRPRTVPGLLLAALARRRQLGVAPFAVVPCDNLQDNGTLAREAVRGLADRCDRRLAAWIEGEVPFCSTMVDRIVPTTTDAHVALVADRAGVLDAWPVVTEPFTQWVVQRHPAVDLTPWEDVGVEVVDDVAAHEQLKLRVLNGAHSALAYLGLRAGHGTISAALADLPIAAFVRRLLAEEVLPTVVAPARTDVESYADTALRRFANAALGYSTGKVAADGSVKLSQRLIPTARDLIDRGRSIDAVATVVAAWIWCLFGPCAERLDVPDPQRDAMRVAVAGDRGDHRGIVTRLLGAAAVLGPTGSEPAFLQAVLRRADEVWSPTGMVTGRLPG
jgi:fructuronate reductase